MPARVNLLTNSSAETGTAGWLTLGAGSTGALALSRQPDPAAGGGAWAFSLNAATLAVGSGNTATAYADVVASPGQQHAVQAQMRWHAPLTGATAKLRLSYRSAGAELVGYDSPVVPATQITYAARSLVAGAVAPVGTTIARLQVQMIGGTASGSATVRFDMALVELGSTVGTYFDGDTADTATTRYDWTGVAHASTSTATPWIDVSLVPSGDPNPVQIVLTGIPNGVGYSVVGTTADGSTWPIPGGTGVSTGGQIILVDNRAALDAPVTYSATWSGATYLSAPITVPYGRKYVIQSTDGSTRVDFWWLEDGLPQEPVVRAVTFDVPGRARPAGRYAVGGDGGGSMQIRTALEDSATMRALLKAGKPLVIRTDGEFRDFPAVELVSIRSGPNVLSPFAAIDTRRTDRVWSLAYTFVDDPEPSRALAAWTWDDFDAAMTGRVWTGGATDFDGLFATSTWDQFDTYPWGQL